MTHEGVLLTSIDMVGHIEWAGLTSVRESDVCTNRPGSMYHTHTRLLEYPIVKTDLGLHG